MSKKDKNRKWIYWFLGVIAAMQLYFVRELLAAFAIFILGFAVIGIAIGTLYFTQKVWESGVARLAASQHPVVLAARRSVNTAEDWALRPVRRAGSQPAA